MCGSFGFYALKRGFLFSLSLSPLPLYSQELTLGGIITVIRFDGVEEQGGVGDDVIIVRCLLRLCITSELVPSAVSRFKNSW